MKSQISLEEIVSIIPVAMYASRVGLSLGLPPTHDDIYGQHRTDPNFEKVVIGCSTEIATALIGFGDKLPSQEEFMSKVGDPLLAALVYAQDPSAKTVEDVHAIISQPETKNVFGKFMTMLWFTAYPGSPINGQVINMAELKEEALKQLQARRDGTLEA